jgi:hypothetical protein
MKPTVLLIRPRPADWTEPSYFCVPPIGLMSIAGVLRANGVHVEILDFHVLWGDREQQALEHLVSRNDLLVVGISAMTVVYYDMPDSA